MMVFFIVMSSDDNESFLVWRSLRSNCWNSELVFMLRAENNLLWPDVLFLRHSTLTTYLSLGGTYLLTII